MRQIARALFLYGCIVVTTMLESCPIKFEIKSEHLNKELATNTMVIYDDIESIHDCTKTCMFTHRCQSVSYHRTSQTCLLHRVNSSVVTVGAFFDIPGSIHTDVQPWKTGEESCYGNTCGTDEQCLPTGTGYVCLVTGAEECVKNPASMRCYKHYPDKDHQYNDLQMFNGVTSAEQCIQLCVKNQPTFKSILLNYTKQNCYCKTISIHALLLSGGSLIHLSPGIASMYERL